MKTNKVFVRLVLVVIALFCLVTAQLPVAFAEEAKANLGKDPASPLKLIEKTIDEIILVNRALPEDSQRRERQAKLREIINPHFNFAEMSKRSLGPHWNNCSEEERSEFVDIFSDLLARTYLGRIDTVKEKIVTFESERIQMPKAIVKTTVLHEGETFPIDYKLVSNDGHWGVYDVVIENIGLVANYRNEFAGIIRREKFAGLMKRLRDKIKKLDEKA